MTWHRAYLDRFYSRDEGFVDGTTEFHELCRANVPKGGRILEVGAGPSNQTSRFLATLGDVDGVDIDPIVASNDALQHGWLIDEGRYPVEDDSYDAVISNYVVEHVDDPVGHLREIHRALKPGGRYVYRTPNMYHYVALISAATPHWFHELVAKRALAMPEDAHDPWPTVYALNTRAAVLRHAPPAGLAVEEIRFVEKEPSYGAFARVAFLAGLAYERFVNATELLGQLRANMFVVLRKE